MDFNVSLRRAIKTGKVILGQNQTEQCINEGKAQMIVVANNCPEKFRESLFAQNDLFVYTFEGSGVQLGKACGKPFMVSALAVVSPGESDILSLKRV
ncbi:MAG TPA: 50S ribosomal protein L30e [Methanoregulaceae archaeon]|nr:MAG: 50S ribosomal protein L30e [Methanolinea sp.]HON81698.1 50S ribosomal protein L30e [Methanoregulaceae archaeon]HQI02122.1 50S ribosomal protein L30e [Deltaproteobacteria bacterium]HPD10496.1 50S ribosomal protein L30e [Methanoregulaceae archaeon]HRT15514.1 50S ribosomal protein L30e [Methanoregulaceae archaeon]